MADHTHADDRRPDADPDVEARLQLFMPGWKSGFGTALMRGALAGNMPIGQEVIDAMAHREAMRVLNDPAARHDLSAMIESALAGNLPAGPVVIKAHSPGCGCR